MNLITLENVSKQYSERLLLDGVDLLINQGDRIGLVGINGSGKTTLLRIIAGQESPDQGSVTVWGGVRIQYLAQEPALDDEKTVLAALFDSDSPQVQLLRDYEWTSRQLQENPRDPDLQERLADLTERMEKEDGWAAEANAKSILTRLGITDFAATIGTLSGGQRKRVALARALIDPADLLILDEPTNHIDAETIDWLETYLMEVPEALLMVTHDRYFLDRVVNQIVELDRRTLISFPGNYSRYLELRAARHERLAAEEEKRRKLLKKELEWVRRAPMARGTKQKARRQRLETLQTLHYDRGDQQVEMALANRRLGKKALQVKGVRKAYEGEPVLDGVDFRLAPGDRIGLVGPNGVGKSTFLDILAGVTHADAGTVDWGETVHVGYYDQRSRGLDDEAKVIDFMNRVAPLIYTKDGVRVEAAKMLEWFLFPRPQQQAKVGSLSGGERRRLYLLTVLAHRPNVILLDEPTNDLDIQTLNVLESFLDAFAGCLIVVSHDRYFLDRTVDFLGTFDNGRFSGRYPTPFSAYQQRRRAERETSGATPPSSPRQREEQPDRSSPSRPRRLSWKEKQELSRLNERIETLEKEKVEAQTAVNAAGDDYQKLNELAQRLQTIDNELDEIMERWLELSEIAEQ